jgi:REase associating with pPIWI_RE
MSVAWSTFTAMTPPALADSSRARDWAVIACCLAASAMSDQALEGGRKAAMLMDCLGVLAAVSPPGHVMTLGQLRAGLSGPMRDLLPPGIDVGMTGEVVLMEPSWALSPEAEDVAREHFVECTALEQHWTHRRVRAEQEEQRLYQELRTLGDDGYSRARGLLTDHASGELRVLRREWDTLWPRFGSYEPVSKWPWAQLDGWWFACPVCKWPMRVTREGAIAAVQCEAHAARGIRYTARTVAPDSVPPMLQPAGKSVPDVAGQPATPAYMAVSRAVWRFVTLPGVLECELRDHAARLGAKVTMWPDLDSYDVQIKLGVREWRIDAKAWASPVRLLDVLKDHPPGERPLYIVLPDHQHPACRALDEALRQHGFIVRTAAQLKAEVSKEARESR